MNRNQKQIFKGYLIRILGYLIALSNIAIILIYHNYLQNPLNDILFIILIISIIIGVFLICFASYYNIMLFVYLELHVNSFTPTTPNAYFIQGVPNNNFTEYDLKYEDISKLQELIIKEIEKGIFVLNLNDKIIRFDMKGWIRKEYYIYEYIMTIIQLKCKFNVYKPNIINEIKEMKIKFIRINNKKSIWFLVRNYKTNLTLLYKNRMKTKYKLLFYYSKKGMYRISRYYNFNKNCY